VLITPVDTVDNRQRPRERTDYACAQHVTGGDTQCHAPVDNFPRGLRDPQESMELSAEDRGRPLNHPQVYPHLWLSEFWRP
jgi:hypothetical protein